LVYLDPLRRFANPLEVPHHHRPQSLRQTPLLHRLQRHKVNRWLNRSQPGNSKGCQGRACRNRDGRPNLNNRWVGLNNLPCNPAGLSRKFLPFNRPFARVCTAVDAALVSIRIGGFARCAVNKTLVIERHATCLPLSMISVSSSQMLGEARTPEMLIPTSA